MNTQFSYITYISSTPEKVWKAILDPKMTKEYWQMENNSDWKIGSRWEHRKFDKDHTMMLVGKVIEFSPPYRLVLSWAFPKDELHKKKHSRVAIDIEPFRGVVRLTVTHDHLKSGSEMYKGISEGWPIVFSSLKSLLERGKALPELWYEEEEEREILKAAS